MNPASNPPIIEAYKKEFGLQEPASTIQKRFIVKGRVKKNNKKSNHDCCSSGTPFTQNKNVINLIFYFSPLG